MAIGKSKKQLLSIQRSYDVLNYDTIPVTNIIDINPEAVGEDITLITSKMGGKRNFNDKCHTTVNFNIETYLTSELITFDNGGTDELYSNLDSLLKQSGMKSDVSVLKEVTYTPDSNSNDLSSMNFYKEDVKRIITGSKNSMTITGEVGKPISVTFNNSAYTDLVPTVSASTEPDAVLKNESMYVLCKIQGYTENGTEVNMQSFTLNQNIELQDTYAIGLGQYDMTDFDYQIEVTALKIKNDISNWQDFENGSLKNIIITARNLGNNSDLIITIDKAKILTNVDGDDAGRQTVVRNFRCENNVGDDNISIKFKNII